MAGYPQVLKYYMWGWQVYYRVACQTNAESLFDQLDRGLAPNVFLIGFVAGEHAESHPVCIEPEALAYAVDEFSGINSLAESIYETDPDNNMFYTGEGMQKEMQHRRKRKSLRLAIEDVITNSPNNPGNIPFVSGGVMVGHYDVYIVLELNKDVYQKHIHLKQRLLYDRMKIYQSLLDTIIPAYLEEKGKGLFVKDAGKNLSGDFRNSEDLLREGARLFMLTIASKGEDFMGLHRLFEACEKISVSRYEGIENNGHILIAKKDHPNIEMKLQLSNPYDAGDYRKTRKLLELSNQHVGVICNTMQIFGLGILKPDYDYVSESIFSIKFTGIHCWDVYHGDQVVLQMRFGYPQMPKEVINKQKFASNATRIFTGITPEQVEGIYQLAVTVTEQKNGAMLIISGDAKGEADRLQKQCIGINPTKLNKEMLLRLTSIDGGILADLDGVVYAQGVILDGIVGQKGDSSRGSRYNSAVTYIEYKAMAVPSMILVVSKDGMIDILPELRPQVSHAEILGVINALEQLNSPEFFERGSYNQVMAWLTNREFYLTGPEIEKINSIKNQLDKTNIDDAPMKILHRDLLSNNEMNEDYYVDGH